MIFEKSLLHRGALGAVATAMASLTAAPPAHAHYGIPHAFSIHVQPGSGQRVLLRSDIWGLMYSSDGGQTWQWSCAEAFGGNSSQAEHVPMVVTTSGRVLAALTYKGLRLSDDMCTWRSAAGLDGQYVMDISATSTSLLAVTSNNAGDAGFRGAVYASDDNGESWSVASAELPNDFLASSVAMAPSDSKRLYVAGTKVEADKKLERSDDGGATWVRSDVPIDPNKLDATLRIVLVHPTRPDVVLAWVDQPEGLGQNSPDDIVATSDGGAHWKTIYSSTGDLPGLALSPDGTTLVIAGPSDGIQSAALDDALAQGQGAFKQVFTGQVWGLHWAADGLYAGNNNFTAKDPVTHVTPPAYMYGVSHDNGHTFTQIMSMCQITYPSCATGTTMDQACSDLWDNKEQNLGFGLDFVHNADRCGGGADAGTGGTNSKSDKSSGCSYAAPGSGMGHAAVATLALLGLGVALRRRGGTAKR